MKHIFTNKNKWFDEKKTGIFTNIFCQYPYLLSRPLSGCRHFSNINTFKLNILEIYYLSLKWQRLRFKDSRKLKDWCPSYASHPRKKNCWLPFPSHSWPNNQWVNYSDNITFHREDPHAYIPNWARARAFGALPWLQMVNEHLTLGHQSQIWWSPWT